MEYNNLQKYIANRIRECRKSKNLSQEKLSELAGLGTKGIQNIENLKYDFKIQTLEKVLFALNITVEEFFDFKYPDNYISIDSLISNLELLPIDKQNKIIMAINEIVKNIE